MQGKWLANLQYLMQNADGSLAQVTDLSALANLLAIGGDASDYSSTTDSLEALSDAIGGAALASVLGALDDAASTGVVTDVDTIMSYLKQIVLSTVRTAGASTSGLAITQTLYVSPTGLDTDGLSFINAFNTIQQALDAASTDDGDCTLILISPALAAYDIDTTGDPTWAANVILTGTYRTWTRIVNTHAGATSILKLTGKSGLRALEFDLGSGSGNGLIMSSPGFFIEDCIFNGTNLTGAATALDLIGATQIRNGRVFDCDFLGHVTHMTGIKMTKIANSALTNLRIDNCLKGVHVTDAESDSNHFKDFVVESCAIEFDLDAGNSQYLRSILFNGNTLNIDDEVHDHSFINITDQFPITTYPDDLVGISVPSHANPATWGADTELRSAATATVPFSIIGIVGIPSASEMYRVRLSADSGSTHFLDVIIDATKKVSAALPSDTEYIFNTGTRISASCQSESGGNTIDVWLKVQNI